MIIISDQCSHLVFTSISLPFMESLSFLDLLIINFLPSSNHILPDIVQIGELFSFTLNRPFKKGPQVLNRV